MYFISHLTDVFIITNFFALPPNVWSVKLKALNRFTKAPRDNFKFGGNSNSLSSVHYPPTSRWAKMLTLNMFSITLFPDLIYIDTA